jgi:hypothetical protein
MPRKVTLFSFTLFFAGALLLSWLTRPTPGQAYSDIPKQLAPPLPINQVILFSSGVGYFQREGQITGTTHVDLAFPSTDVNDLLKSLVLQDMGGGHVSTITYDSPDPIEKTLKSFALDLTYNPTFGQILNQARGEKVEITCLASASTPQASLTGVIVGMESRGGSAGVPEVDLLNLLGTDGLRNVHLATVQRVRFLNPALDSEFKRALEVLAGTHDSQKKLVSLEFSGQGNRTVRVGYVVENPMWKTSYRLVLPDKGKPYLQGWAIVENTSDEDWKDVRMALVSGRPISFQLGLYEPLYVPRPWVEPELFASLRPPVYSGALASGGQTGMGLQQIGNGLGLGGLGLGGGIQGGFGGGLGFGGGGSTNLGVGGGNIGFGGVNRYQNVGQFGNPVLAIRPQAVGGLNPAGQPGNEEQNPEAPRSGKLTYEELQQRLQARREAREQAKRVGSQLAAVNPAEGVASLATAEEIGDQFQYVIDQRVNLPRQKSALLPIVHGDVQASKVSIFNQTVHPKFPILGLRFKNTSGHPLVQGPVTVYEHGNYAGDARLQDLQPNEERLIGYALDLGTEIKAENREMTRHLVSLKVIKGILQEGYLLRQTKTYVIKNRSAHDRDLLLEHPLRSPWKLIAPDRTAEVSREAYRFQLQVPAGRSLTQAVVEEQKTSEQNRLLSEEEPRLRLLLAAAVASPRVKGALEQILQLKARAEGAGRELTQLQKELEGITLDQARIRANLDKLPQTSDAYKRYLKKFDTQETDIERLQAEIKQFQGQVKERNRDYESFVTNLSAD